MMPVLQLQINVLTAKQRFNDVKLNFKKMIMKTDPNSNERPEINKSQGHGIEFIKCLRV